MPLRHVAAAMRFGACELALHEGLLPAPLGTPPGALRRSRPQRLASQVPVLNSDSERRAPAPQHRASGRAVAERAVPCAGRWQRRARLGDRRCSARPPRAAALATRQDRGRAGPHQSARHGGGAQAGVPNADHPCVSSVLTLTRRLHRLRIAQPVAANPDEIVRGRQNGDAKRSPLMLPASGRPPVCALVEIPRLRMRRPRSPRSALASFESCVASNDRRAAREHVMSLRGPAQKRI